MKQGIHPDYVETKVSCACGNTFVTRSTKPVIHLDICSQCHPFFSGQQKFVDAAGRVEQFKTRFASTGGKTVTREKKVKKAQAPVRKPVKVLKSTPTAKTKPGKSAPAH